ncbi:TPA: chromosome partition protein MukE [Morganella morganii subsp. morganii]|uniref:Chromosome partition protein MukE n=1 Tax=Morganella morganii TaxID=582 RepID=A0AAU8ZT64_MORMO|nr:chromosome partition protein MukE [Morganella morganii]HDU8692073.1 chromosome partition protein MukE [Morganella morganii subsp. morganii]AWC95846.1 chromosome partition protein MukE [Morganella morganii]EKW8488055.1 chromosome partition protein MukE [Morganella morganii]HAT3625248.1 chromosome partition protein MukE [Morganella morganii]HCU0878695.1 chromosome partition protein MukE [Morganella morganii]
MSSTHIEQFMSAKLAQALANNLFPELDSQLRAGRHIGVDDLDNHAFLMDFQDELEGFYARYNVELIRAPEGFFYLRPRSTTLIPRSVLSELEMLVGKVLCYLYLSPERLANQGIFSTAELYEELLSLADEAKLLKVVNNRSTGSDLDKQKLLEKTRGALNRLRRLGMITFVSADNSQFVIAESVFRFGADVRSGDDPREAQLRLIRDGEAQSLAEEEKHPRPEDQDDDNEESEHDNATDEAEDEE